MMMYRALAAGVGAAALLLQYYIVCSEAHWQHLAGVTFRFFSFFTIISNSCVVLVLGMPLIAPRAAVGRFFLRPTVRGAAAVYITVTTLVYFLLLRDTWNPQGLQLVADYVLHYVMPALYLYDWFAFARPCRLRARDALDWLIVPAVYAGYILLRGSVVNFYPYFFMDVGKFGYPRVLLNVGLLGLFFVLLGLLCVWQVNRARRV